MDQTKKGIVMKVTEEKIVLMMEDGSFSNISLKDYRGSIPLIGQSITHTEQKKNSFSYKRMLPIASLLLFSIVAYLFFTQDDPQAAYILAIDINPSIELTMDKDLHVIAMEGLNEEGERILEDVKLKAPLDEVVDHLLYTFIENGFITEGKDIFIAGSVISLSDVADEIEVEQNIASILDNKLAFVSHAVSTAPKKIYEEAKSVNLSVNHYKQVKVLQEIGVIRDHDEVRGKTIAELKKMEKEKTSKPEAETDRSNKENTPIHSRPDQSKQVQVEQKQEENHPRNNPNKHDTKNSSNKPDQGNSEPRNQQGNNLINSNGTPKQNSENRSNSPVKNNGSNSNANPNHLGNGMKDSNNGQSNPGNRGNDNSKGNNNSNPGQNQRP